MNLFLNLWFLTYNNLQAKCLKYLAFAFSCFLWCFWTKSISFSPYLLVIWCYFPVQWSFHTKNYFVFALIVSTLSAIFSAIFTTASVVFIFSFADVSIYSEPIFVANSWKISRLLWLLLLPSRWLFWNLPDQSYFQPEESVYLVSCMSFLLHTMFSLVQKWRSLWYQSKWVIRQLPSSSWRKWYCTIC